jgi:hypothetical protein
MGKYAGAASIRFARGRSERLYSLRDSEFHFMLKPLFDRLCHKLTQNRDALVEQLWLSTSLLDQLGLWVTEIFLKARKEVIERQQQEMLELSTSVVKLWQGIVASRAGLSTVPPLKYSNPCRSRKFFTAPQPSPRVRGGSKKFTNDLGSL